MSLLVLALSFAPSLARAEDTAPAASTPPGGVPAHPLELRASAGALIEVQSHGELDLGLRAGALSAELYTDTLDLRWTPTWGTGRGWVDVRAEGAAAGLMITPWAGDAPDPGNALLCSQVGPDAGLVRYLPAGFWVGGQASARFWSFGATNTTTVPVPGAYLVSTPAVSLGWWSPTLSIMATSSVDLVAALAAQVHDASWGTAGPVGDTVSPALTLEAKWHPRWLVSPRFEARLGSSQGKGAALAFRLGGGTPYGVPVVGYGWARFWASDYAAVRAGVFVGSPDAAPGSGVGDEGITRPTDGRVRLRAGLVADRAFWSDYATGVASDDFGLGLDGWLRVRRTWLGVEGGYGMDSGQAGLGALTFMARAGLDWGRVGRR